MQKKLFVRALLVCAATWMAGTMAFAGDNWVGSWKLDAAKSKITSGAVVRAQTLKFEATPAGIKLTSEGTDPQGKPSQGGYVSKFDGQDVPWAGNPQADTAAPKRIDANTYENVWKKGGKVTVTAKVTVSKFDGQDVPWAGNPQADTAAPKRIDANTYENVWKKGGKVTVTAKVTVSKDGKTLTVTQTGTDTQGAAVSAVAVYDRQ